MSDNDDRSADTPARPRRSARWFDKDDLPGFVHRSTLSAAGWSREDLMQRPIVGILNTWSDINPCNMNLRALSEDVRSGIVEAGGIPFDVPLMSVSENIIKPTSFPFRNLLAMDAEECIRAYPFDAVVLLGGCDKTQPALIMGAASAGVPFIFMASGPATPRSATGGDLANATGVWRMVDKLRAGEYRQGDFAAYERSVMGTVGHCAEMGTASSMAAICEALGISLSGSSMVPAVDRRRNLLARDVGRRSVALARSGAPRGDEILDHRAFDNAITLLCALGGSTNVIIHLLALAGRVGVPLTLDRFDEIGRRVPLIANIQPAGEHLTERLMTAGGIPAVLKTLKPLLHLDARTVEGSTLGELIDKAEVLDPEVIRPLDNPVRAGETLVVVRGNLAPDGAVMKACAADPKLFRHRGRAIVFEDVQSVADKIDDPTLGIDENSVLILRNAGPVGAAMPEWGMLPLPRRLLAQGVTDMLRVSDARMSGTAYGAAILHVSPEAAIGGPLALVRDGDLIEFDLAERRLELLVDEEELAARRRDWRPPTPSHERGYRSLFRQHVEQANRGCDFDFLRGGDAETLPDGLFDGWVGGW